MLILEVKHPVLIQETDGFSEQIISLNQYFSPVFSKNT